MGITLEYFFCGDDYRLTAEESKAVSKWVALSDSEKETILKLMETFAAIKN